MLIDFCPGLSDASAACSRQMFEKVEVTREFFVMRMSIGMKSKINDIISMLVYMDFSVDNPVSALVLIDTENNESVVFNQTNSLSNEPLLHNAT